MIRYLIVDDEHIAHDIVKKYCDILPDMELAKHCYNALEALEYLRNHQVELIFLDLNMPKLRGFEFLKTLQNPPKVIVTTAYQEFALEGYELNVSDYLLKPFSFERFLKAVNKTFPSPKEELIQSSKPIADAPLNSRMQIFLYGNKKHTQVFLDEIQFIEASGNYLKVFINNEIITVREKISEFLPKLDEIQFIQVHKSFAVSSKHITSIEGNQIFIGDNVIPIGRLFKRNVQNLIH